MTRGRPGAAGLLVVALAACANPAPTPAPDPINRVVDVHSIADALDVVSPGLRLVAYRDNQGLGVFPDESYINEADADRVPRIVRILVFPSIAERARLQPRFGEMQIVGDGATINWDGPTHSEWLPARNALVEVQMPGGTFGVAESWRDPDEFLGLVRSALAGL